MLYNEKHRSLWKSSSTVCYVDCPYGSGTDVLTGRWTCNSQGEGENCNNYGKSGKRLSGWQFGSSEGCRFCILLLEKAWQRPPCRSDSFWDGRHLITFNFRKKLPPSVSSTGSFQNKKRQQVLLWRLWIKPLFICGGWLELKLRYRPVWVGFMYTLASIISFLTARI
jgi:hypothetical protein